MIPSKIAVLGGGLSGLSSAYHLSRRFPKSQIVLLEKQSQLGGWVRSDRVSLPELGASVLLEGGPRTLRPNNESVLELINLLNLQDEIITVSKSSPPAKSRYLYIHESPSSAISGLQLLPTTLTSLLSSPLSSIMFPPILREIFKRGNRPADLKDESVDSFFKRRFGETFARTFGSALVHGIYAADSRKLSVRSAFPVVWDAEDRGFGGMIRGLLVAPRKSTDRDDKYDLGDTLAMMRDVSVYSFREGLQTLTNSLVAALRSSPNVTILENTAVSRVSLRSAGALEIKHSSGPSLQVSHAVSALPLPVLERLVNTQATTPKISNLTYNPLSTVTVVNLVFPCPPKDLHPEGFGYLIPRPPDGYPKAPANAAPGILGTVFDSCSLHEQDSPQTANYYTDSPITKLTMMTGGPYPALPLPPRATPAPHNVHIPQFIRTLLDTLQVQLGRPVPDPVYWRIWNNEQCIPTLLPGHLARVQDMKNLLTSKKKGWGGRLEVIGAGVGGVSVGDCVQAGRNAGRDW